MNDMHTHFKYVWTAKKERKYSKLFVNVYMHVITSDSIEDTKANTAGNENEYSPMADISHVFLK